MGDATINILTRAEATDRRQEILGLVGDEQKFRARGESYELDSDELVLYDELRMLDYLLDD
mgnify:FL=1|jgi:hypothetical protein